MDLRTIGVAAWLLLAASHAGQGPEPKEPDRPWGEPSGGLRSRIWLEKVPARTGDPVIVRYEIQNVGISDATSWHSGFWSNHRVDVTTPEGEAAKSTPDGAQRREAYDPYGPRDKNVPFDLRPEDIDSAFEPIDVGKLFEPPSGEYRIQVVYQERRMEPVRSNVLVVTPPAP